MAYRLLPNPLPITQSIIKLGNLRYHLLAYHPTPATLTLTFTLLCVLKEGDLRHAAFCTSTVARPYRTLRTLYCSEALPHFVTGMSHPNAN